MKRYAIAGHPAVAGGFEPRHTAVLINKPREGWLRGWYSTPAGGRVVYPLLFAVLYHHLQR
jgi:hypothetical protein